MRTCDCAPEVPLTPYDTNQLETCTIICPPRRITKERSCKRPFRTSARFVAANTSTPSSESNPSISVKSCTVRNEMSRQPDDVLHSCFHAFAWRLACIFVCFAMHTPAVHRVSEDSNSTLLLSESCFGTTQHLHEPTLLEHIQRLGV